MDIFAYRLKTERQRVGRPRDSRAGRRRHEKPLTSPFRFNKQGWQPFSMLLWQYFNKKKKTGIQYKLLCWRWRFNIMGDYRGRT